MSTRHPFRTRRSRFTGFSLVELLVVVAIIGIIGSIAVPAVGSLLKGSSLTQAANLLTDQAALARQYALSRNRVVELRFYSFVDPEDVTAVGATPTPYFRAFQFFEIAPQGIPNPVGKIAMLPSSTIMNSSSTLSTLLSQANAGGAPVAVTQPATNDPELPRGVQKNYTYVAFRFLPDGTTNLPATPPSGNGWFLTVHTLNDMPKTNSGANPPPNFFTWMIDPVSGASKILRPGL